jgi:formyl-CoA transferase
MMLADLGARVVKVERPGTGDDTRMWGPPFVGLESAQEATYFLSANRGKESVVLDLRAEDDRATLEVLRRADVLIENFRAGVMDRLGLGRARLEDINPRLVTLSIPGVGSGGPDTDRTGYDQIVQGEGGLMSITGPTAGQPTKVGVPIADIVAGMFGAFGLLAALHERDESGRGQTVTTSLLAGQIAIHTFQGTRWLVGRDVPGPSGNHHPTVCPYGMFPTADRNVIVAVGNDTIWERFAPLLELERSDDRFSTNAGRVAHRDEVHALVERALLRRGANDWLDRFAEHGIPAGEVKTLDGVYASEQARDQSLIYHVSHPTLGDIELPGMPLAFSRSPAATPAAPPTLGQHDEAIRAWVRRDDQAT